MDGERVEYARNELQTLPHPSLALEEKLVELGVVHVRDRSRNVHLERPRFLLLAHDELVQVPDDAQHVPVEPRDVSDVYIGASVLLGTPGGGLRETDENSL